MKLRSLALREMRRRPGRAALTVMGIAIGVAAIVSVQTTVETARGSYRSMFRAIAGRAALEVVADDMGAISRDVAAQVAPAPGVRHALPVVQSPAVLLGRKKRVPVMALGIDARKDAAARRYGLAAGRFLSQPGDIVIESAFARQVGLALDDRVGLLAAGGRVELRLVGLLEARGAAAANGGAMVFMGLADAGRLAGIGDRITGVQLVLAEDVDPCRVARDVRKMLAPGLTVQPPASRGALGQESMARLEQVLALISVLSIVAGAFVVLNALLMNLSERRRRFAILRAIGMTRRQLRRGVLGDALLLGVIGTLIGIPLGIAASALTTLALEKTLTINLPGIVVSRNALLEGLLVGPLVSLLAGLGPSVHAARRPPLDDLLGRPVLLGPLPQRAAFVLGTVCLGLSAALLAAFLEGSLSRDAARALIAPGSALFLSGWVLLMPAMAPPLLNLVSRVARPAMGMEGRLAARQLQRNPVRTSLTVGVLFISVVVTIGLGTSLLRGTHDIDEWYDATINSDYYIRGTMPDGSTLMSARIPAELLPEIAALKGVAQVVPLRFIQARVGNAPVIVVTRPYPPGESLDLLVKDGDSASVLAGLHRGEVAVSSVLAHRLGLRRGDRLSLQTRAGPRELGVAGVFTAYTAGGAALAMDWSLSNEIFRQDGVDAYLVDAARDAPPDLEQKLAKLADRNGLLFQSRVELTRVFNEMIQGVNGMIWALLVLMFLVASMGTVNSLTMNVLDQVREIGVLRAVAMRRRELARMILSQGLLMAAVGALPGVVAGIGVAWIFNVATPALSGYEMSFTLYPGIFAATLAVLLVMTVLASLLPVRHASRLPIIEALHLE